MHRTLTILLFLLSLVEAAYAAPAPASYNAHSKACSELAAMDLSQTQDAPTQLTKSELVPGSARSLASSKEHG